MDESVPVVKENEGGGWWKNKYWWWVFGLVVSSGLVGGVIGSYSETSILPIPKILNLFINREKAGFPVELVGGRGSNDSKGVRNVVLRGWLQEWGAGGFVLSRSIIAGKKTVSVREQASTVWACLPEEVTLEDGLVKDVFEVWFSPESAGDVHPFEVIKSKKLVAGELVLSEPRVMVLGLVEDGGENEVTAEKIWFVGCV